MMWTEHLSELALRVDSAGDCAGYFLRLPQPSPEHGGASAGGPSDAPSQYMTFDLHVLQT